MSLLIWLPLNGDTQNKGLGESLITSKNITYTSGKIGNSAYFNNSYITLENTPLITGVENFSISFWFKTTSPSSTQCLYNGRQGVGTAIAIFTIGGVFRFDDGTQRTFSYKIPNNKWEHYTFVRTSSDIKFYVNGVLKQTFVATKFTCNVKYATIGASSTNTSTGSGNAIIGNLNDYRIYDHALSAKEVKEISKGLCIHYQLKGDGAGENLYPNSQTLNNSNGNVSAYKHETIDYDGVKVRRFTATNDSYGPWSNGFYKSDDKLGKIYTWSLDIRGNRDTTKNLGHECGGAKSVAVNTQWQRVSHTWTFNFSTNTHDAFIFFNNWQIGDWLEVKNFKIEEGSKATPWIPKPSDTIYTQLGYNSNIEPDCSGFGFNGTITGSLPTNINSPRYNTCRTFESNKYIRTDKGFPLGTQPPFTISLWYKPVETTYGTWADVVRCGVKLGEKTALWRMECYNNTGLNYAWYGNGVVNNGGASCSWTAEYNKWHHLVQTFDGTIFRQYVNGTQVSTYTLASAYVGFETTGTFGVGDYGMYGDMSDVRVYATCLTAEDVKEIYNTSASIDKKGNLHCYELEELKNTPSIENVGIVSAYSSSEYHNNFVLRGTPDISNGFLHNPSYTGCLTFPFIDLQGKDFSIKTRIKVDSLDNARNAIFGQIGKDCILPSLVFEYTHPRLYYSMNGTGWYVNTNIPSFTAEVNTWYTIELITNSASLKVIINDEIIYEGVYGATNYSIGTNVYCLGNTLDFNNWLLNGDMDLSQTSLRVGNTLVYPTNLEKCSLGKIQATANSFIEL